MKLKQKTYAESRLDFFKEQHKKAERRLKWAIDHDRNWMELEDDGDQVSYFEWAVKMAERELERELSE